MANYFYQTRDAQGNAATGVVQAVSAEAAGKLLREQGGFVVKIRQLSDADTSRAAGDDDATPVAGRVKRADVIFFAHQMAIMIDTGVPMSEALESVTDQCANPAFKLVLADITEAVQSGTEFSRAMGRHPKVFPPVMVSLIKASEISGTMGTMLDRISQYMSKEQQTRKQIRGALMYPMVMLGMALGVTIFLLAFVLPRFAAIYGDRGVALPAPTRLLLTLSGALVNYWHFWAVGAAGLVALLVFIFRTRRGRHIGDWLKLHTPIFSHLFTQLYLTRACRTMGTMIAAGVSMLDMVAIVRGVTVNYYYEQLWDKVDAQLRRGAQLSDPLFGSPLVPRSISQMIYSGEKSGRLGEVLNKVAVFTEQEFDQAVKTTTQFIEPVIISFMGGLIGFVAISLLLPIFSVGKVMAEG